MTQEVSYKHFYRKKPCKNWKFTILLVTGFFITVFIYEHLKPGFTLEVKEDRSHTIPLPVKEENFNELHVNPWISKALHRNASLYIKPNTNTALLIPASFCEAPITLLVIIFTTPGHFGRRRAIRDTWGSYLNSSNKAARGYFFMGKHQKLRVQRKVRQEFLSYADIIQEQFLDTKYNGSVKALMMLKIVNDFCVGNIEYFVKTVDDVYVNIPQLLGILPEGGRDILMGNLVRYVIPNRNFTNEWYVPLEMFLNSFFPDYLKGSSYLMASNVVSKIYNASFYLDVFFMQNVYITGILPKSLGLRPINHETFIYVENAVEQCILNSIVTFIHKMKPSDMLRMHRFMQSGTYKKCDGTLYVTNDRCFFVPNVELAVDYFSPSVLVEFFK